MADLRDRSCLAATAVVAGARPAAEVETNLALFRFPIPPEPWRDLKADGLLPVDAHVPGQAQGRSMS
jgi:hypothetical protein